MDTHFVPEAMGGEEGGLVLAFGGSSDSAQDPVNQLVDWVLLRLELYGIAPDKKTSLVSLHLSIKEMKV